MLQWVLVSSLILAMTQAYFILPQLQICDNSKLRTFRKNFCPAKLVFTTNFTKINSDCMCFTGVWLIMTRDCIPSVIVSNHGCLLTPQIKAVQHLGTFGKDKDFFAVVSQPQAGSYELSRPVKITMVQGYVWLLNGLLNRSDDGAYCAQKWPKRIQKLKGYRNMARYEIQGRFSVQWECPEGYKYGVEPQLEYGMISGENSECQMNCLDVSRSRLLNKRKTSQEFDPSTYIPFPPRSSAGKVKPKSRRKSKSKLTLSKLKGPTGPVIVTPSQNRSQHTHSRPHEVFVKHMNARLLLKLLSFAFPRISPRRTDNFPKTSFQILERIFHIVVKVCGTAVSRRFLRYSIHFFKALYEVKGSHLLEYLGEDEGKEILSFLNQCYGLVTPMEWEDATQLNCKNNPNFVKYQGEWRPLTWSHNRTFFLSKRHLAVEVPWNVIDISVAACIDAFSQSYILYHKMEQAMERLFTKDLRTMWKVPPTNAKLYKRLYGPYWEQNVDSLEKCVEAIYIHRPKLSRLRRPDETLSGRGRRQESKLQIPGIVHSRAMKVKEKGKCIIPSAHLYCQPFDLGQCQEQKRASGWN